MNRHNGKRRSAVCCVRSHGEWEAGTPAAERDDQVLPEVKAERAKRLEAIEERLRADDMRRRCGSRELALVESEGNATTESYHGIDAPEGSAVGDLVECEL